jgi:hypothetical protein
VGERGKQNEIAQRGRRKEVGGRRKEEGGRRKEEGGRRKEEGGRRKEEGKERCTHKHQTVFGGSKSSHKATATPTITVPLIVLRLQHQSIIPPSVLVWYISLPFLSPFTLPFLSSRSSLGFFSLPLPLPVPTTKKLQ